MTERGTRHASAAPAPRPGLDARRKAYELARERQGEAFAELERHALGSGALAHAFEAYLAALRGTSEAFAEWKREKELG